MTHETCNVTGPVLVSTEDFTPLLSRSSASPDLHCARSGAPIVSVVQIILCSGLRVGLFDFLPPPTYFPHSLRCSHALASPPSPLPPRQAALCSLSVASYSRYMVFSPPGTPFLICVMTHPLVFILPLLVFSRVMTCLSALVGSV